MRLHSSSVFMYEEKNRFACRCNQFGLKVHQHATIEPRTKTGLECDTACPAEVHTRIF